VRSFCILLVLLLQVGGIASAATAQCPDGTPPPCAGSAAPARNSLAVLYFQNASGDSAAEYLATGLTDAIIVRLGSVERLQVKSRGSVRRIRPVSGDSATEVGRRLNVAHLVTGTIRRTNQRLRVTVELVQVKNGMQLWAEQYDRPGDDIFAVERDIASAVAVAIAGRLLPRERVSLTRPLTSVRESYDAFLRGNYLIGQRTAIAFARALVAYDRAVQLDPAFNTARARIAYTYALAVGWDYDVSGLPPDSLLRRGLRVAEEALRRDSTSADAWLALALLRGYAAEFRPSDVLASFDRATALDPRNAEVHHVRGWYLFIVGAIPLALDEWHVALALEPERPVTLYYMARAFEEQRLFAECSRMADSALALDPRFGAGLIARSGCRAAMGDLDGARSDANEAIRLAPGGGSAALAVMKRAYADYVAHDTAAVRRELVSLTAHVGKTPRQQSEAFTVAALHAFLGEHAQAVEALEVLRERPGTWRMELRQHQWDVLRAYPPFTRLVADLHMGGKR
jgi:adenylate cyclase